MRNKQAIEGLIARLNQIVDPLYKDMDSGKPHITTDYAKQQLYQAILCLESLGQYIDLEN